MNDWQPIATAPRKPLQDLIVWNGKRVCVAWRTDDGEWDESTIPDYYDDTTVRPPPTHWMPWPKPPSD